MNYRRKGVLLFVIGVLFICFDLELIKTGIDYKINIGNNEGLFSAVKEYIVQMISGKELALDILFNPFGYILIICGIYMQKINHKFANNIVFFSIVGMICNLILVFLPAIKNATSIYGLIVGVFIMEIISKIIILYSYANILGSKVDGYKYMEVGKDLRFAAQLYGVSLFCTGMAGLLVGLQFFFASVIFYIIMLAVIFSVLYYVYKIYYYVKKLGIFLIEEEERK